jgi:FlaA1/EpsC-like NDP-sugar epimerase
MELYNFAHSHKDARIRPLLGDVRDKERLRMAFRGCDIVVHAAAVKHVDIIEYNPTEAVKTNITGTMNAIEAAIDCNVSQFVLISTDKAVKPSSTMGCSKMMCERLVVDMNDYAAGTMASWAVRFGNVLGSAGSVLETFVNQVRANKPITITNEDMTRFFMHIEDAATLILESFLHAHGGEIFVLKMPACKIGQLVKSFVHVMGLPADYPTAVIGFRPGEKEWEELLTEDELLRTYDFGHLYVIADRRWQHRLQGRTPASFESAYRSDLIHQMSFEECNTMVRRTLEMMGVVPK